MKKHILVMALLFAMLMIFTACAQDGSSNSEQNSKNGTTDVTLNIDDEVRACFEATNAFRLGSEAFYLNEDNTTTTSLVGTLSALTLDEDLCKAAQIRANEIVSKFDHTRPNGTSCFTVLSDLELSYSSAGENIAAGNKTGTATFTQWKEDNKDYSGQGHRRNMLGNFTKIGIAYTYDANSTYKYYWTMILTR